MSISNAARLQHCDYNCIQDTIIELITRKTTCTLKCQLAEDPSKERSRYLHVCRLYLQRHRRMRSRTYVGTHLPTLSSNIIRQKIKFLLTGQLSEILTIIYLI